MARLSWEPGNAARRVDLDTVTAEDVRHWTPGETILLSGTMYTGRDAAHKRMTQMLQSGEPLPVDLTGKFIYYVGPVDPVGDEVVGPAGPTTATRMDKFTDYILEQTGLIGMIGKAERGPIAIEAIKRRGAVYLMAVGGAAYLVSKAIIAAKVVAFEDLGMEAIYAFTVKDMPCRWRSIVAENPFISVVLRCGSARSKSRPLSSSETFYWHDYETSGAEVSADRPLQFAGMRTDRGFNVIGEPLVIYSRPTPDFIPSPVATRITGISPYTALEHGLRSMSSSVVFTMS